MAACQTSLRPGCLTALETGSLRPCPLVLELSIWAGHMVMTPWRFISPYANSLVFLGFLDENGVDYPILARPGSHPRLAQLSLDDRALGDYSSPLIVHVRRVPCHSKKF